MPAAGVPWYRTWWVRGPVLGLFLVVAGLQFTSAGTWLDLPVALRVVLVPAVALAGLAFWTTIVYVAARTAGRHPRYASLLVSFPLILLTWLSAVNCSVQQ